MWQAPRFVATQTSAATAVHLLAEWNGYDVRLSDVLHELSALFDEDFLLRTSDIDRFATWLPAGDPAPISGTTLALVVDPVR